MTALASLAFLPGLVFADLTVPPGPFPHADAVRTVAETFAVAVMASARCPDLFVSSEVDKLQTRLGLTGRDSAEIVDLQGKLMKNMATVADTVGAPAWCEEVYGCFGSSGSSMKGLLKRCEAGPANC